MIHNDWQEWSHPKLYLETLVSTYTKIKITPYMCFSFRNLLLCTDAWRTMPSLIVLGQWQKHRLEHQSTHTHIVWNKHLSRKLERKCVSHVFKHLAAKLRVCLKGIQKLPKKIVSDKAWPDFKRKCCLKSFGFSNNIMEKCIKIKYKCNFECLKLLLQKKEETKTIRETKRRRFEKDVLKLTEAKLLKYIGENIKFWHACWNVGSKFLLNIHNRFVLLSNI